MHEICRHREKEQALRERSRVKSFGSCSPRFDFYNTCSLTGTWISNFLNFGCRSALVTLSRQVLRRTKLSAVCCVSCLFRISMLGHAGHDIGFDHRQPNHSILSYGSELGAGERPPSDQQNRLDFVAPASALCQRVAPSWPGWGKAGEGLDYSGWEAPREQSLHEEVSPWLQQQRIWVGNGVGHQWKQAKGKSFSSDILLLSVMCVYTCAHTQTSEKGCNSPSASTRVPDRA